MTWEQKYILLLEADYKSGHPTYYKNDLINHDKHILQEQNPFQFLWMTRESGTHFDQFGWL